MKRTLIHRIVLVVPAVLALAATAVPASADDHGHRNEHQPPAPRHGMTWIRGHYEAQVRFVTVPAVYENRYVPAVTERFWVPEVYEEVRIPAVTQRVWCPPVCERVWVPEQCERVFVPAVYEDVRSSPHFDFRLDDRGNRVRFEIGGGQRERRCVREAHYENRVVRAGYWTEREVKAGCYETRVISPERCERRLVRPGCWETRVVKPECNERVCVRPARQEKRVEQVWVPGHWADGPGGGGYRHLVKKS